MQVQSSAVKIIRKDKRAGYNYGIILDGIRLNSICVRPGETVSVPVEPGYHSLKLTIDWCSSKEINFSIGSGEEITFECKCNFSRATEFFFMPYYAIFDPYNFILLKQCYRKDWSIEETEATLVGAGLATETQLRKLKHGQSFLDSNGQRWWKYRNKWPRSHMRLEVCKEKYLYCSNPMPKEEKKTQPQPQPTDAVLGGTDAQPRPYDAVLGGKSKI